MPGPHAIGLRWTALRLPFVALAVVVGCAPILGIEDAQPLEEPSDDSGAAGPSAGGSGSGGAMSASGGATNTTSSTGASSATGGMPGTGGASGGSGCGEAQVAATGSPGFMYDFESVSFDAAQDPGSQDGRSGGWYFYPTAGATGEVAVDPADAGNSVALFSAMPTTPAWAGISVQFLDETGAAYDASAYAGVRFRVKGHVDSTAEPGIVTFNVVSTATQSAEFGGCLPTGQELDKFHKEIDLGSSTSPTTDFVDYELTWDQLDAPAWSTPDNYPLPDQIAVDRLLLLDWGIHQDATDFAIYLDDVELIEK